MIRIAHKIKFTISGLAFGGPDDKYSTYIDRVLDFSTKLDDTLDIGATHEMTHTASQTIDGKCVWVVYIDMPTYDDMEYVFDALERDITDAYEEVMNETGT
jgi:hypothetical protein